MFDPGARRLLARAYARPGMWVGTRVAVPDGKTAAHLARLGIQWAGPDKPSAQGGRGLDARTRWVRGFVRAMYYQHKNMSDGGGGWREDKRTVPRHAGAIEIQVGRAMAARERAPAGRAVRVMFHAAGGQAAKDAARARADSSRIYTDDGAPGQRWSDPALRDW
jgi:hypothetical protein